MMQVKAEDQVKFKNSFIPRSYQLPILQAIEEKGYKRVVAILPRRAGKDMVAFYLCIRHCLRKVSVVYYIFPTYAQAKKVIWDSITNDGKRILDMIPENWIESKNSQEMKIRFKNGSLLQLVGSDNYDGLVGTNPQGVVFSEYALQDPRAYQFIRPILTANDGWALFISTPRGKNHLWELYQIAMNSDEWFGYRLTVEDTQHIPLEEIEREKADGLMSEDLIMQEYYCFPADQNVLTYSGMVPISEIKSDDLVISHTGRTRRVLGIIERDYEGDLIEIKSYGSGELIRCTPDHPLRTYNINTQSYLWKKAQYLSVDDLLVFPKKILGEIPVITESLCMLLAWYICDGSASNNAVQFTVNKRKSHLVITRIESLGLSYDMFERDECVNIVIYSTTLVDFFRINCGTESYNKYIPFDLIASHERLFFEELMRGDGCLYSSERENKYTFTTVSKSLAYQLQMLAHSVGLVAGITVNKRDTAIIEGRIVPCRDAYQINMSLSSPLKRHNWLRRAKYSIVAPIRFINRTPFNGKVYNLKVQFDESYIVEGRAVHNCSFDMGVEGAYYMKYLDKMRIKGQIGQVPWEPGFKVNTAWDLGVRDATTIIFFQVIGMTIRIIDCYENSKEGLEHYVGVLESKPYSYGKHIAPHDIKVREFGSGITRWEKARQLGISFIMANDVSIVDGIEAVRSSFAKIWIDEASCVALIKALENYRQEFDAKRRIYKSHPLHDFASHFADAMRYLCVSLPKVKDGASGDDIDRRYNEARYGDSAKMPSFFRDDNNNY